MMQPEHFEAAVRRCPSRPVAVMPVHLAGQVVDMKAVHGIASRHGIKIIEDAAHAIGTVYEDGGKARRVGDCSFSDATAFSFHPVKNMTTGEGGAVLVRDAGMAAKLRRLRSHGMVREADQFVDGDAGFDKAGDANPWYYEMSVPGYNYRLTDIQAALGISQLAKLETFVETRLRLKKKYDELLFPYADIVRPVKASGNCKPAWHLYIVLIDFERLGTERSYVMKALLENGIASQVHYIPVHRQPYYKAKNPDLKLPGAEEYYARSLTLPLHVNMDEGHVERVVGTLVKILGGK
ncbi:MAG TPA: UDP-4-amino-4,6-dideoxy-N-acetyl-beta-L-altrosamine transaminase [Rhodospirillaceae bacterium]|nr:UDP-4-amino-4,6-dideoxy-N-acetyl-beta-L-altrosamine transaminase [Rhodospirillaceae bacterium]